MRKHKTFWDKNAGRYDRFMRKDGAAYDEMYALIRPVVRHKTVLELATGTGLIAKHIVNAAAHIEATDASAEMITEAKRDSRSAKLHFSVQDMFHLPYADKSFDVVIVSNALHIVPQPEKALQEIKRINSSIRVSPFWSRCWKPSGRSVIADCSGARTSFPSTKKYLNSPVRIKRWPSSSKTVSLILTFLYPKATS